MERNEINLGRKKINLNGSLDDINSVNYYFSIENELFLEIETWNYNKLLLVFDKPIMFIDHGNGGAAEFCYGSVNAPIVQQAINRHYIKIPEEHPYKLFQLLDLDDDPSYEIVCENFKEILTECSFSHVAWEIRKKLKEDLEISVIAQWASAYLVQNMKNLNFELRELLHCIAMMKIFPELKVSKEELLQVVEETHIDVNDFGKPRPKQATKHMIDRTYRYIQRL